MTNSTILKGQYVKCRYFLGHPAFKGETDVTVRVLGNQVFYQNKPIQVSKKGWKSLKLDMEGIL
jgi:hypothetical protein